MIRLTVIDRRGGTSETTNFASNASWVITGARLTETTDGTPHLRIEPRVADGLTLTESKVVLTGSVTEEHTTSKIGIKLKQVAGVYQGLQFEADTALGKTHEKFLVIKLGTNLSFNAITGAIDATGGSALSPATVSTLGGVIVGNGLSVTVGGTLSLAVASASQLGGIKIGTGLTVAGDGTVSVSAAGTVTGSGTISYVPKWTSGTSLGNSNLYESSGQLVLGGTTPSTPFLIQWNNPTRGLLTHWQNTAGSSQNGAQLLLTQTGVASWAFGQPAATSAFAIWADRSVTTDGSELLRLTSSGNLGVGTNNPGAKLHVAGAGRFDGHVTWGTDNTFDLGASGASRPRDLYLARTARVATSVIVGTDPNPAHQAKIRTDGDVYAAGAMYATDFVLLDGTGSSTTAGPAIEVFGKTTVGGGQVQLTTSSTPLSRLRFTGNVTVNYTSGPGGDLTVNVTGSSGVGLLAPVVNAVAKYATDTTLTASNITDTGSLVTVSTGVDVTGRVRSTTASTTATSVAISGNALTLNTANASLFTTTLNQNISVFSITPLPPSGQTMTVTLIVNANGAGYSVNWGTVKWANDVPPVLTTTLGKADVLTFLLTSTTIYGFVAGLGFTP